MIVAAALCPAPPLLARELTGAGAVLPELSQACADATAGLLAARPDLIVVAGAGDRTRTWGFAPLPLAWYAPGPAGPGGPPGASEAGAPMPLGLGARLLDQAGHDGPRLLQAVSATDPAAELRGSGHPAGRRRRAGRPAGTRGRHRAPRRAAGPAECRPG